jgi:hypothetical protein
MLLFVALLWMEKKVEGKTPVAELCKENRCGNWHDEVEQET